MLVKCPTWLQQNMTCQYVHAEFGDNERDDEFISELGPTNKLNCPDVDSGEGSHDEDGVKTLYLVL